MCCIWASGRLGSVLVYAISQKTEQGVYGRQAISFGPKSERGEGRVLSLVVYLLRAQEREISSDSLLWDHKTYVGLT